MAKYYQGRYTLTHPEKYRGDTKNVIYRSSWELQVMRWCDLNSKVTSWNSEEKIVPYRSPIDGRIHKYFPDFMVEITDQGKITVWMVEVKPKKQTQQPKRKIYKGNPTKKYLTEVQTYAVNQAKWEAAMQMCENNGWKFMIITEDNLKGMKSNGSI